MKKVLFLICVAINLIGFSQSKVTQNLGDFTTLKVFNGIEVELIKSESQKIEITGKRSEEVVVKNIDKTLKLTLPFSLNPDKNNANGEVLIKLYYNTTIATIDANGGSTITGKEIKQEKLVVNSQERAFINLVVNVDFLEVKTSSGGIIKLTGAAKNQVVDVDLYGVYNGYNLKSEKMTDVKAGTGAKAEVFAVDSIKAKVSFGGSIFYKGDPKVLKDKKVIGGIIQKRD